MIDAVMAAHNHIVRLGAIHYARDWTPEQWEQLKQIRAALHAMNAALFEFIRDNSDPKLAKDLLGPEWDGGI